jgi:peptidoglycan/LPS O-acetylase OafA/YrhL
LSRFDANTGSEKLITPRKARILAIVGAVVLLHAALLLLLWPHYWPNSYKWLMLPDGVSAYFVLALGLQQMKRNSKSDHSRHEAHESADTPTLTE